MGFKVLEGLEDPEGVGEVTHWPVTAGSHHCLPGYSSERNSGAWRPVGPAELLVAPPLPGSHGAVAAPPSAVRTCTEVSPLLHPPAAPGQGIIWVPPE